MVEFHVDHNRQFASKMNADEGFGGKLSALFVNAPTILVEQWKSVDMLYYKDLYEYTLDGVSMTEVHALQFCTECHNKLRESMAKHELVFSRSLRCPLFMLGQDEVIFKQYISSLMEWKGVNGKVPMKPKDDGLGLMGSGVNMRELGYGNVLSDEGRRIVNEFRRTHRPHYVDVDAAKKIKGGSKKKDFVKDESPFNVIFEYGNSAECYWTYDHMIYQLEDIVDVLDALHSSSCDKTTSPHTIYVKNTTVPNSLVRMFEYLFLTDHSCGHD